MAGLLAWFVGALLGTVLLTQLFLWLLRSWKAEYPRLITANGLSLFLATVLAGFGHADGGAPDFQKSFASYVLPQIVYLLVGLYRVNKKSGTSSENMGASQTSPGGRDSQGRIEPKFENPAPVPTEIARQVDEDIKTAVIPAPPAASPPTSKPGRRSFIARHWRGEFPLWISYWIFGFFANVALLIFSGVVSATLTPAGGYDPTKILIMLIAIWAAVGLVAVWQMMGIWRSANRYIDQKHKTLWPTLAKIAVILGVLRVIIDFTQSGYPQLRETYQIVFYDDPTIPDYSIRVMRNGTEVEVAGGFKFGLDDDFNRVIKALPNLRVVHLNSDGGRIGEAKKLYRTIQKLGLTTYTSDRCQSACTIAFAAGRERWILRNAKLGYHASSFPGMTAQEIRDADQEGRDLYIASGITPDFVRRALSTPNESMWTPNPDELIAGRAISGVVDSSRYAASGFGANLTREAISDKLTKVGLFAAIRDVEPRVFSNIVDDFSQSYFAGETEQILFQKARAKIFPVIQSRRGTADDRTVLDLGRLLIEQLQALSTKDKALCYQYASGVGANANYTQYLPPALVSKELEISERLIRSPKTGVSASPATLDQYWSRVGVRLASRFNSETIALLTAQSIQPAQYGTYCDLVVAMYQEILALGDAPAANVLRQNFAEAGGAQN
ncbi:hypothetical protein [Microvirga sp. 17 mud 1-3]|uniref:COG3904 family protein n=1 Tax=Microvirga sp. 17 mud 1-3 TaxID=2082949 RepID=UPI000D6CCA2A|nr:hypothetical protein [Microvirga sp. 17 mud 1-3]AWM87130.1 hypothetical protein C4E04_10550 [Microvirga sp. 17 mud 1-3]